MKVALGVVCMLLLCVVSAKADSGGATTQSTYEFDRHAAVIEIVPPQWIQASPDANALWQRIIDKHVALLHHPKLIHDMMGDHGERIRGLQGLRNPELEIAKALRIRAVPGTPLIELSMIAKIGDADPAQLAEALADQYVESVNAAAREQRAARRALLQHDIQRMQFRVQAATEELNRAGPTSRPNGASTNSTGNDRAEMLRLEIDRAQTMLKQLQDELNATFGSNAQPDEVQVAREPLPF